MNFTEQDLKKLKEKGISKEKVLEQVATFKEGIPFVSLEKAAVIGEGISSFSDAEQKSLVAYFEANSQSYTLLKFVPASGAASRMFKAIFNFIETYDFKKESIADYIERTKDRAVEKFVAEMSSFPFYKLIENRIENNPISKGEKAYLFAKEMLIEDGLNYGFFPKGLLPFHRYGEDTATPFEEHLKEAVLYAKTKATANLHFTISEQHEEMFTTEETKASSKISKSTNTAFNISYSNQKSSTDTIAVNLDNTPFRNADGSLLFRPGGHGALIENLNDQDADIIFIKNIDNVVVDPNLDAVAASKKMLAGLALKIQNQVFEYIDLLETASVKEKQLITIKAYAERTLNVRFTSNYEELSFAKKCTVLKDKLNRPIRVCGMVKNEGEPGGGPFFIKNKKGEISLQIVESAQIDRDNTSQVSILKNATHFNPVDLICTVRNYKGEKFDLLDFVDTKQGFITNKTKEGKELKALELPGLWNGAMAFWNTIFVEVPLVTFNPVKTVNDLLKPSHQA